MTAGPILITGGSGQLATCLQAQAQAHGLAVRRIGRPALDFDALDAIADTLAAIAPRMIINAAAYTAVDKAESEPDAADRANHLGPRLIAEYCAANDIPLIHVSTDYVFDGAKGAPYIETDAPNPTGVYGATKLAGERAVLAASPRSIVLRTSWVYSAVGKNFLLTMLNAARRMPKLRVVADQIGNPTNAGDLARAIITIAAKLEHEPWHNSFHGVFHAANSGFTSWHGFATSIFRHAAAHGLPTPELEAIATSDWPTPARRPADSRLDCSSVDQVFGIRLPEWESSLAKTVDHVFGAEAVPDPRLP